MFATINCPQDYTRASGEVVSLEQAIKMAKEYDQSQTEVWVAGITLYPSESELAGDNYIAHYRRPATDRREYDFQLKFKGPTYDQLQTTK